MIEFRELKSALTELGIDFDDVQHLKIMDDAIDVVYRTIERKGITYTETRKVYIRKTSEKVDA